jgi:hypothetical protein
MPIRLGDGTPVEPQGIQEVRLGDGTILFTSSQPTSGFTANSSNIAVGSGSTTLATGPAGPADFQIVSTSTNAPVSQGQTLDVTYTIDNVGGSSDTQVVTLDIDGAQEDSKSETVAAGDSVTTTLSYGTQSSDPPDVDFTVTTLQDTATGTATVNSTGTSFSATTQNITINPGSATL